jgi:hypothetical protein
MLGQQRDSAETTNISDDEQMATGETKDWRDQLRYNVQNKVGKGFFLICSHIENVWEKMSKFYLLISYLYYGYNMFPLFTKICYGVINARQSMCAVSHGIEVTHQCSKELSINVQKECSHVITLTTDTESFMKRDIHLEAQTCLKTMFNGSIIPAPPSKNLSNRSTAT